MKKIDTFLRELYELDPTLREHEAALKKLIAEMLAKKPEVEIDDRFIKNLRARLVDSPSPRSSFFTYLFMTNKPLYAGAGVVLSLAILIGVYQYTSGGITLHSTGSSIARIFEPIAVSHVSGNAFGNLAAGDTSIPSTNPVPADMEAMLSSRMPTTAEAVGLGGGGSMATSKMIAPMPYRYTYTYTGDPIELTDETMPVYKRNYTASAAERLGQQLSNAGTGLLDLSSFGNLKAENISFYNDDYRVSLDLANGHASLYKNYEQDRPITREPTEADLLPEQELIDIANAFLRAHGISTEGYGSPVVDMQWRANQERQKAVNPELKLYVPNIIGVVYPYNLESHTVSNYSGEPDGLRLYIDIFSKKVNSLANLRAGGYVASDYAVTTDSDRIISLAEKGGMNTWYRDDADEKVLELGTPTLVYIEHYMPQSGNEQSYQLYIPALQFPITSTPGDDTYYYGSQMITIPLVTEVLDEANNPIPVDPPIMLMKGGAEPAVEPAVLR